MSINEFIGVVIPTQSFFIMIVELLEQLNYLNCKEETIYSYRTQVYDECKLYSTINFSCKDAFDTDTQFTYLKHFLHFYIKPIINFDIQKQYKNKLFKYFSSDVLQYCIFQYLDIPKIMCEFITSSFGMNDLECKEYVCFGIITKTIYFDINEIPNSYTNPRGLNHSIYSPIIDNSSDIKKYIKELKYNKRIYKQLFKKYNVCKTPMFYRMVDY